MVRKVVRPATSSVRAVVRFSESLKSRSSMGSPLVRAVTVRKAASWGRLPICRGRLATCPTACGIAVAIRYRFREHARRRIRAAPPTLGGRPLHLPTLPRPGRRLQCTESMSHYDTDQSAPLDIPPGQLPEAVVVEVVRGLPGPELPVARIVRRRVWLPVALFVATCLSAVVSYARVDGWVHGLEYAVPLMTILVCHEAGHFLQARRYGVYSSYPYFIPMPLGFIGTFGAVIVMEPRMGDRRALFDIGISGPLAGLVPTLIFCAIGLHWSEVKAVPIVRHGISLGEPLLFQFFTRGIFGPVRAGHDIFLHPMAFAGWVGLLITALNLLPIGQLDGGHVLYALLRRKARYVATMVLSLGAVAVVIAAVQYSYMVWVVMLVLLMMMGPIHPPTADDYVPLGPGRTVLGWLTLAFVPFGLTPTPFLIGPGW